MAVFLWEVNTVHFRKPCFSQPLQRWGKFWTSTKNVNPDQRTRWKTTWFQALQRFLEWRISYPFLDLLLFGRFVGSTCRHTASEMLCGARLVRWAVCRTISSFELPFMASNRFFGITGAQLIIDQSRCKMRNSISTDKEAFPRLW